MVGLNNLITRLNYRGGIKAEDRFIKDKLDTLKKSLISSYQAENILLEDGRMFRALINPDKMSGDYHDKIISIPYEDVCLNRPPIGTTAQGQEIIGMKPGDTFTWLSKTHYAPDTDWIVVLRYPEENAYFRADIRQCNSVIKINDKEYKIWKRGPAETELQWKQKKGTVWNDLNYSLVIYITKDSNTLDFFHRFTKVKIDKRNYEVVVVNEDFGDTILKVCLNEWFSNSYEDEVKNLETETPAVSEISGPAEVHPYDIVSYTVPNSLNGDWVVSDKKKAKVLNQNGLSAEIEILTGRSGQFDLRYERKGKVYYTLPIVIKSF